MDWLYALLAILAQVIKRDEARVAAAPENPQDEENTDTSLPNAPASEAEEVVEPEPVSPGDTVIEALPPAQALDRAPDVDVSEDDLPTEPVDTPVSEPAEEHAEHDVPQVEDIPVTKKPSAAEEPSVEAPQEDTPEEPAQDPVPPVSEPITEPEAPVVVVEPIPMPAEEHAKHDAPKADDTPIAKEPPVAEEPSVEAPQEDTPEEPAQEVPVAQDPVPPVSEPITEPEAPVVVVEPIPMPAEEHAKHDAPKADDTPIAKEPPVAEEPSVEAPQEDTPEEPAQEVPVAQDPVPPVSEPITEPEAPVVVVEPIPMPAEEHAKHDAPKADDTPVSEKAPLADMGNMGGDHGDHNTADDMAAITPPGPDADAKTIAAYVTAVRAQTEMHMHSDDMAKMAEHMAAMDLAPRAEATHIAVSDGDWFDSATWHNGEIPGDDAKVLIPEGIDVQYGIVSDARLFTVRIDGELDFATDMDSRMVFDTMVVSPTGTLVVGSVIDPVDPGVSVELIVADNGPIDVTWDPMLLSRGIVSHGEASIHGAEKDAHEKVLEDPMEGDTSITFADLPEGWEVGDKIVIAGTRYDGYKWDNDVKAVIHHDSEDEIRIISAIEGDTVFFEEALVYDHDTPRADLKTSVANYTRNISVETENADDVEVHERGHVMFMHSDDVDVRYAAFNDLGRTDKSELSLQVDDFDTIAADSNVQGRYSLHLHRAGTGDQDDPVQIVGNAVWGSPGWGYVHHDSNADLTGNASYDTFGAGYVAETGNETGSWTDNIAIYAKGVFWGESKHTSELSEDLFDTGKGGDGFWFQGRLVESNSNVAASVNHGFAYFHRDGDDRMLDVNAAHFDYSGAIWDREVVGPNDPSIVNFTDNETFAANMGLEVVKPGFSQSHDIWTHIDGLTAWSVREGVFLEYTSHYLLSDIDIIAKEAEFRNMPDIGIELGKGTGDVVIIDSSIDGFAEGIFFDNESVPGVSTPVELGNYTVVDTTITNTAEPYTNYMPEYNTVATRADLEDSGTPDLQLEPLYFRSKLLEFEGTKTDGLGTTDFVNLEANFRAKNFDIVKILEEDGYWSTSDGTDYFLIDIYFSDRETADVYYETHSVELDAHVTRGIGQWWSDYENVSHNGIQDIVITNDGTQMAGDVILDEAFVAVPFVSARDELQQVSAWEALTQGQGTFDDDLPEMATTPETVEDWLI